LQLPVWELIRLIVLFVMLTNMATGLEQAMQLTSPRMGLGISVLDRISRSHISASSMRPVQNVTQAVGITPQALLHTMPLVSTVLRATMEHLLSITRVMHAVLATLVVENIHINTSSGQTLPMPTH
jgi:hypothetical protein